MQPNVGLNVDTYRQRLVDCMLMVCYNIKKKRVILLQDLLTLIFEGIGIGTLIGISNTPTFSIDKLNECYYDLYYW